MYLENRGFASADMIISNVLFTNAMGLATGQTYLVTVWLVIYTLISHVVGLAVDRQQIDNSMPLNAAVMFIIAGTLLDHRHILSRLGQTRFPKMAKLV